MAAALHCDKNGWFPSALGSWGGGQSACSRQHGKMSTFNGAEGLRRTKVFEVWDV